MQTISLLTYNLLFGKAFDDLIERIPKLKPDIVCVQEFPVNGKEVEKMEKIGYSLADYSYSFFKHFKFYSVATFYNPKKLIQKDEEVISLSKSLYEFILFILSFGKTERTALNVCFQLKGTKNLFNICNLHLTALQSTNKIRDKQLKQAIAYLDKKSLEPTVIAGDLNYLYKRKFLESILNKHGFKEATNNIFFSLEWNILRLFKLRKKTDYIWYRNIKKHKVLKLKMNRSDHFPIYAEFKY